MRWNVGMVLAAVVCIIASATAAGASVEDDARTATRSTPLQVETQEPPEPADLLPFEDRLPPPPADLIDLPGSPEPLTPSQIDEATRSMSHTRTIWGLPGRADMIRELLEKGKLVLDMSAAPFPLFGREELEVPTRLERSHLAHAALSEVEILDGFGGAEFDPLSGTMTIATKVGSEAALAVQRSENSDLVSVDARVELKEYLAFVEAHAELEGAKTAEPHLSFGLTLGRIEVFAAAVDSDIAPLVDLLRQHKVTREAAAADFLVQTQSVLASELEEIDCTTRLWCGPAKAGGLVLERLNPGVTNRYECTIGFMVKRPGSSDYGLVTAAHCDDTFAGNTLEVGVGRNRTTYPHIGPNALMATVDGKINNANADIMVVNPSQDRGLHPYISWFPGLSVDVPISGSQAVANGSPVCQASKNRWATECGVVTNASYSGGGVINHVAAWLPVVIQGGDSGGPNVTISAPYNALGISRLVVVNDPQYYIFTKIGNLANIGWELVTPANFNSDPGRHNYLYKFYDDGLHREPDVGGWNYWYWKIGQNCPTHSRDLAWQVLTGSEITSSLPINSSNSLILYWQVDARLKRLYHGLLARSPDAGGYNYWSNHITSGSTTAIREQRWKDAVYGFIFSGEFNTRLLSGTQGELKVC